jgi:PST family polysaccharide transporter
VAIVVFGAAWGAATLAGSWPALLQVVAGAVGGAVVLAAAALVPAYRRDYAMMLDFVRRARRPSGGGGAASDSPVDAPATMLGADEVSAGELQAIRRVEADAAPRDDTTDSAAAEPPPSDRERSEGAR